MSKNKLYRITFSHMDSVYEIYANKVCESEMFGFIEVGEFVFGENTALVVDPSEERLKSEFSDVNQTYIPMNAVIRIDEVAKKGTSKVHDKGKNTGNISMLPIRNSHLDKS